MAAFPSLMGQIEVECLNCGADWLDYVAAFGGVGSAVLAVVAIVLARRAGRDARRSANAAERTAEAASASAHLSGETAAHMRDQLAMERVRHAAFVAEQNRRPQVLPTIEVLERGWSEAGTPFVVIEAAAVNQGDKEADEAHLILFLPTPVRAFHCDAAGENRHGAHMIAQSRQELRASFRGESTSSVHGVGWVENLKPGGPRRVSYYWLSLPDAGEYALALRVIHPDLEGGSVTMNYPLSIEARVSN